MRALIRKEWLENRALILGFLIIAPLLSIGFKTFVVGWEKTFAEHTVSYFAPAMLTLFLMAVAADLVAADSASGRIAFLAALPARPATVFSAKLLFLFGAAVLYLGYLLATEAAILTLGGRPAGDLVAPGVWETKALLVPAVVGAATLFWSTLLDRGFAAAFAALATLVGLGFLLSLAGMPPWTRKHLALFDPSLPRADVALKAFGLALPAFLVGSLLAFTRGRIHLGARLRRAALAAAGFLLVISPPAAWAAHAHHRFWNPRPSDRNCGIGVAAVSPDGEWAIVLLTRKEHTGPLGVHGWALSLWAVRLDGTRVVPIEGGTDLDPEPFSEGPGRVVVRRPEPLPGDPKGMFVWLRVVFDLEEERVLRTRAEPVLLRREWWPHRARNGWAEVVFRNRKEGGSDWGVRPVEGGDVIRLSYFPWILPSGPDGAALALDSERTDGKAVATVLRVPLDGSGPAAIAGGEYGGASRAPSSDVGLVRIDGRALLLRDGAATPVELPENLPLSAGLWSGDDRLLLVRGGVAAPGRRRASRLTIGEDGVALETVELPDLPGTPSWTDGTRVLLTDWTAGTLTLVATDGTVRRLVPPEAR